MSIYHLTFFWGYSDKMQSVFDVMNYSSAGELLSLVIQRKIRSSLRITQLLKICTIVPWFYTWFLKPNWLYKFSIYSCKSLLLKTEISGQHRWLILILGDRFSYLENNYKKIHMEISARLYEPFYNLRRIGYISRTFLRLISWGNLA